MALLLIFQGNGRAGLVDFLQDMLTGSLVV